MATKEDIVKIKEDINNMALITQEVHEKMITKENLKEIFKELT